MIDRLLAWLVVTACVFDWVPSSDGKCFIFSFSYNQPLLSPGDLDLDSMRAAGSLLVGSHDFRNFCKMDVGNAVVEFIRRLDAVYVEELASTQTFNSKTLSQSGLQVLIDTRCCWLIF